MEKDVPKETSFFVGFTSYPRPISTSKREIRSEVAGVRFPVRSFLSNRFTHLRLDRSLETRFWDKKNTTSM